jgi:PhzF family phenazine biosynthesis protein
MSQRTLLYSIVDVFAEHALEGNPLAVFSDARSLSTEEMQALARETNLAETTFILPADDPKHESKGVRVRIFTTQKSCPLQAIQRLAQRAGCTGTIQPCAELTRSRWRST